MSADRRWIRLYELLRFPGYTLLLVIDPKQAKHERAAIHAVLSKVDNNVLKAHVLLNNGLLAQQDFGVETFVDYRGAFESRMGGATERVFLVRPDAYTAFVPPSIDSTQFVNELAQWQLPAPRPSSQEAN